MAWFVMIDGYEDPKRNGFFAATQGMNKEVILTPIKNILLDKWHTFSIDWRTHYVRFWIDNTMVAEHIRDIPS